MTKPRAGRRYGQLGMEEVRIFLPDTAVVNAKWVIPGAVFTEIQTAAWAHIHVLGLVNACGVELAGPGASAAGWGLRSFHPSRGWLYFETRKGRRRRRHG